MNISKSLLAVGLIVAGSIQANHDKDLGRFLSEFNAEIAQDEVAFAGLLSHCDNHPQDAACLPVNIALSKMVLIKGHYEALKQQRKAVKKVEKTTPEAYEQARALQDLYKKHVLDLFESTGVLCGQFSK